MLGPLAAGAGAYAFLHLAFRRPMTLYVFGHELTHALAALVSGYRVRSLFVSEKGGEVRLSDTNVAVALAPYCIPLYTLLVLALYALVRRYADLASPPLWVGFGLGLTLAFHGALTFHALRQGQPDLKAAGTLFSLMMIALANSLALAVALKALFPSEMSFQAFARTWWADSRGLLLAAGEGLSAAARWAAREFAQ